MMGSLKQFANLLAHVSVDPLTGPRAKADDRMPARRPREQHAQSRPEADRRR